MPVSAIPEFTDYNSLDPLALPLSYGYQVRRPKTHLSPFAMSKLLIGFSCSESPTLP